MGDYNDWKELIPVYETDSGNIFFYDKELTVRGYDELLKGIKSNRNDSSSGYIEGFRFYIYKSYFTKNKPVLFAIQAITLVGQKIVIKSDKKDADGNPRYFIGDPHEYMKGGLKALSTFDDAKVKQLPPNLLYGAEKNETKFNDYVLIHSATGQSLRIEKNNCIATSIDSVNYDVLPRKNGIIDKTVIINFKPTYAEFFSLNTVEENNEKQITLTKYKHLGMEDDFIDYEKYGTCLDAKLDPNKNFVVGIFKQGDQTSCKILRVDAQCALMASIDNITKLIGFDDERDIVVVDTNKQIRKIDCSFSDYPMYLKDKIPSLNPEAQGGLGTQDELTSVLGSCTTYPELFSSLDFVKAMKIVFKNNKLVDNTILGSVMTKVATGSIITLEERDDLIGLMDADNETLVKSGDNFVGKLEVRIPEGKKRGAPLLDLLLKDDDSPDSPRVLTAYKKHLQNYAHAMEAKSIEEKGIFSDLTMDDGMHTIMLRQGEKYVPFLEEKVNLFTVYPPQKDGTTTVEYLINTNKITQQVDKAGKVLNKTVSSSEFTNQPTLNDFGRGVAIDTNNKHILVTLNNSVLTPVDGKKFTKIDSWGTDWWYGAGDETQKNIVYAGALSREEETHLSFLGLYTSDNGFSAILARQGNTYVCLLSDGKNITKHTLAGEMIENEFATSGIVMMEEETSGRKMVSGYKLINGKLVVSEPLSEYGESAGSFRGVTKDNTFFVYAKGSFEETTGGKMQFGYAIISTTNIASSFHGIVCFDEKNKLNMYAVDETGKMNELSGDIAGILGVNNDLIIQKITIAKHSFICKRNNQGVLEKLPYTNLSDPISCGKDAYYWFEQDAKYGIGRVHENKREEWLPATTHKNKPSQFTPISIEFGGSTYNFTKNNEFVELKHDYDVLEGIPGRESEYIVGKEKKRGFAKLVDGKVVPYGLLAYDDKPNITKDRVWTKLGDKYVYFPLSGSLEEDAIKDRYFTSDYKPIFTHIDQGFVFFEHTTEEFSLELVKDLGKSTNGKKPTLYKNIEGNGYFTGNTIFRLEKVGGGYDFLVDGVLWSTYSSDKNNESSLKIINEQKKLDNNQFLVIGESGRGDKLLCVIDDGTIYTIYQNEKLPFCSCVYSDDSSDHALNTFIYRFSTGGREDLSCEYVIIKEDPGKKYMTFRKTPTKKNDTLYKLQDFKVEDGTVKYAWEGEKTLGNLLFAKTPLEQELVALSLRGFKNDM